MVVRKLVILLISALISCAGFSQAGFKRFRISGDIELVKLSEDAYVHISYSELPEFGRFSSNGLIYIDRGEAILLDTPVTNTLTKELVTWLKDSLHVKITGFVPNHWHSDCLGGLGFLKGQKIESYACQKTIEIAKAKNLPVPSHEFQDSIRIQVGDKHISCYYLGAAHSSDNIVAWIEQDRILFAGCMVKSLSSVDLGNTSDADLMAYPKTIDSLLVKFPNAKIVIPGHGQFGGIDLIKHTRELLNH